MRYIAIDIKISESAKAPTKKTNSTLHSPVAGIAEIRKLLR